MDLHYALDREAILRALASFHGVTTADGNIAGTSLVCSALIGSNDFITGKTILLQSGNSRFEDKAATAFNPLTGEIIVDAFSSQVLGGTSFYVLNTAAVDTAPILAALAAIQSQTDKLAGEAPVTGSTVANWNAAESDVISIGAAGVRYKRSLLLSIHNLVGNVITVRLYMQVNGVERRVYEQAFDATADPPGLWVVNGTVGIHEALRVTLQSNNAADNGQAVDYDYMLEAM